GSTVVFLTPRPAQGDHLLQLYAADGPNPKLIDPGQSAEDFVLGDPATAACGSVQLVAFRTREAHQGSNLNALSDSRATGATHTADDVLQVDDVVSRQLVDVGQAVTPCRFQACDPSLPYRVSGSKVRFLTLEFDQGPPGGTDLNDNDTTNDIVVQVFDF